LIISVEHGERVSLEQMRSFLGGSEGVGFAGCHREQVYSWVERTLRQQNWSEVKRDDRGLMRQYLEKMTGMSRAQITRLIGLYVKGEAVRPRA
jgi:hypothetical protein